MTILLVASALALLVVSAVASPTRPKTENSLNIIYDLAEKYNESLNREFFVEDVRPLVDAGCEDTFFCKVNEILHKRQDHANKLVNTLKTFTDLRNVNCTELVKDAPSTGVLIQLTELMKHLIHCVRQRNFKDKKSSP